MTTARLGDIPDCKTAYISVAFYGVSRLYS